MGFGTLGKDWIDGKSVNWWQYDAVVGVGASGICHGMAEMFCAETISLALEKM